MSNEQIDEILYSNKCREVKGIFEHGVQGYLKTPCDLDIENNPNNFAPTDIQHDELTGDMFSENSSYSLVATIQINLTLAV